MTLRVERERLRRSGLEVRRPVESISAIQKQQGPGVTVELGERDGLGTWQEAMLQAPPVSGAHGNVT